MALVLIGCGGSSTPSSTASSNDDEASDPAMSGTQGGSMVAEATGAEHVSPPSESPALDGYCPVALVEMNMLEAGSPQSQSSYESVVYQMTNERSETMFQRNPTRYVPPFGRTDVVHFERRSERVDGSVELFFRHEEQIWFFTSEENRATFEANPAHFVEVARSAGS